MADGRWTMTKTELDSVACGMNAVETVDRPHHGEHRAVDDRDGKAEKACAFCGSGELEGGFGGYGKGFIYRSMRCGKCGGITDFVSKDEVRRFFPE